MKQSDLEKLLDLVRSVPACLLYCTIPAGPLGMWRHSRWGFEDEGKWRENQCAVYLHEYCTVPAGPLGMWRHWGWGCDNKNWREISRSSRLSALYTCWPTLKMTSLKVRVRRRGKMAGKSVRSIPALYCTVPAGLLGMWRHSRWGFEVEGKWRENQWGSMYLPVYCTVPAGLLGMWRHSRWGFEDEGKWRPALSPVATWTGQLKKRKKQVFYKPREMNVERIEKWLSFFVFCLPELDIERLRRFWQRDPKAARSTERSLLVYLANK